MSSTVWPKNRAIVNARGSDGRYRPFTWTKTADEILSSLADYLAKLRTGHAVNEQE